MRRTAMSTRRTARELTTRRGPAKGHGDEHDARDSGKGIGMLTLFSHRDQRPAARAARRLDETAR